MRQHYNPIVTSIATIPRPVIAAIDGVAAGAGAAFAYDLAAQARDLAGRLAAGPTAAHGAIKESLLFAAGHGLAVALDKEAELRVRLGETHDHKAATAAFVRKEKPVFRGS
ncbi:MAG TPA: hypothetical protein VMU94_13680 [Streptosporangiaceae bacterium]|nr:hypothetical protein [Streptosporangiaceae bacterium]